MWTIDMSKHLLIIGDHFGEDGCLDLGRPTHARFDEKKDRMEITVVGGVGGATKSKIVLDGHNFIEVLGDSYDAEELEFQCHPNLVCANGSRGDDELAAAILATLRPPASLTHRKRCLGERGPNYSSPVQKKRKSTSSRDEINITDLASPAGKPPRKLSQFAQSGDEGGGLHHCLRQF